MPLPTSSLFEDPSPDMFKFASRRSVVHSTEGIVSCTQPLAASCGLEILRAGGNAADAAVAVAAGLNMTEPTSTGIGGDMFILFYDASTKQVKALNGSGRSGRKYTLDAVRKDLGIPDGEAGFIPMKSALSATVPGAAAGWVDTVKHFGSGKLNMAQILEPAIRLGEKGFPVSEVAAYYWQRAEQDIREASSNFAEMLKVDPKACDGVRAPRTGDIFRNPSLARTFRTLAEEGKKGFYTGRIAEQVVKVIGDHGGHLDLDDLRHHLETGSERVDAISIRFQCQGLQDDEGLHIWEHPPNGQGIVALMALGIIQELEKQGKIPAFKPSDFNTAPYLHAIIEALRIAFSDGSWYVADPNVIPQPVQGLLSSDYLSERARLFDASRAMSSADHGHPKFPSPALQSSDTVYFSVSDAQGNAASFINSNYGGFGTAMIPAGCGFTLQNRGANFSLVSDHPNRIEPRKRPYHTIIPGMVTNAGDNSLHSAFGVMGGFMQPQGHVQVLLGQVVGKLNPQQALDAPRICIGPGFPEQSDHADWTVNVEDTMPLSTIDGLRRLGHKVVVVQGAGRGLFGRGQIIRYTVDSVDKTPLWSAASDMRADGAAYPL